MEIENKISTTYKKYRIIIIPIVICAFALSFSGVISFFIINLLCPSYPCELSEFSNLAWKSISIFLNFFLIFAIIQILIREIHRFSHLKLIDTLIISIALLELLTLSAGYFITGPVILFGFGWMFIIMAPISWISCFSHVNDTLFSCPHFRNFTDIVYFICMIFAWISIPIILTRKVLLKKKLIYLFLIPPLLIGIAFMIRPPIH